jgi:hypothetical protein
MLDSHAAEQSEEKEKSRTVAREKVQRRTKYRGWEVRNRKASGKGKNKTGERKRERGEMKKGGGVRK